MTLDEANANALAAYQNAATNRSQAEMLYDLGNALANQRKPSKLDAAIAYMRERGIYCLDQGSKPYTPANGVVPQPPIAQPTKLDEDCSYGGLGYLRRFDGYAA